MKLGFWNRLAVVAGILTSLSLPSWNLISTNSGINESFSSGYSACAHAAYDQSDPAAALETCRDIWFEGSRGTLGLSDWLIGIAMTAVGVVSIYAILWLGVWTVKWIWQGRRMQENPE